MENRYPFLERLEKLDPDLAEEARQEIAMAETEIDARGQVIRARRNLSDVSSRYAEDMTGQDGEEEIEAAAREYCDSQDDYIKRTDPDRWAEMRAGA